MGTEASLALPSVRIFLVPQPTTVGITEFFFFPEGGGLFKFSEGGGPSLLEIA